MCNCIGVYSCICTCICICICICICTCNRLLLLSTSRSTTAAITTTTAVTILLGHLMSILMRVLVDSPESNTALGIEEPECEYACVRASEFDANSL